MSRGLPLTVLAVMFVGACALRCSGSTAGTLCGVPLTETIVETLVLDTDTTTLIELSFRRAPGEGEPVDDGSLYLCDDDSVTINGVRARPIERAPGQPVYSATASTTAPQYSITIDIDGARLEYTAQESVRDLELLTPDPFDDWSAAFRRGEPMSVAWTEPALEDDAVSLEIRDEVDGRACLSRWGPLVVTAGTSYELPANSLTVDAEAGVNPGSECPAFLRLSREGAVEMLARSSNNNDTNGSLYATPARALLLREVRILSQP